MTIRNNKTLKVISIFLSLVLLVSSIPLAAFNAAAAGTTYASTADESTMDGWKTIFKTNPISTENAGGVWTDKSVFTDASAFSGTGITKDEANSFLVALSTIGSSIAVTGMTNVPTDTMLVLDVSGSMNSGNNDVAEELVEAANESIATLLAANEHNRVGVVLYSGPNYANDPATATDSVLMLPLGRYTTANDGEYLRYISSSGAEYVALDADTKVAGTNSAPTGVTSSKRVLGATYIQKGVIQAMNQFTAAGNSVTVDTATGTVKRKPVMVLMSDGAPTVSSTTFTNPQDYNLGNGQNSSTNAAQGFVTQLSAAYAKNQIEAKYGTDCLFYTLGLGVTGNTIATSVLDPANSNTGIDEFWVSYNAAAVGDTVRVQGNYWNARNVTKIAAALEQVYVDKYFAVDSSSADLAQGLKDAFADIVGTIQLQSRYYPTLISESEDLSGYVSFVDKVGEHMEVTDVKGILIHNTLFSGADLASNFVEAGGALGTKDQPTELGLEMVYAVQQRLGIEDISTAETLIQLAYTYGQLRYNNSNDFSNYIGWYANQAGEFLGFYEEAITELPEATGNTDTDPAFTVKSYGYLGEVDAEHGVAKSDMMYATVQVRTNIKTGEQIVTFAVPAALIPLVTYNVTLDEDGKLDALTASGAQHPIRLVYEVALDDAINEFTVKDLIDSAYLADEHNVGPNGEIYFYSNKWDHHNAAGYGMVNTYSYFNPARQNSKYYFVEDAPVYADANGTLYTGTAQPSGDKYHAYSVYEKNGSTLTTKTAYRKLSAEAMATAVTNTDGSAGWHIPKGNVFVNLDGYTIYKGGNPHYVAADNVTGTLSYANLPFVDTANHSVNDTGYNFYVGATLGNNGRLTVQPETGIKLIKTMTDGTDIPTEAFTFVLMNLTDTNDNSTYPARYVKLDGTVDDTATVSFSGGRAIVNLYAGEMLYSGGMTAGENFRVIEQEVVDYVLKSVNGSETLKAAEITVAANTLSNAHFVNAVRGKGNLTVAKEVTHDFGDSYAIPADKKFTITVKLSGIGTANATFAAAQTGSSITSVTTDVSGSVTVTLGHDEKFEIFGLPEGTVATVVESTPGAGFVPSYWDDGVLGDGVVTIGADKTSLVAILNDYNAAAVYPVNIHVGGTKFLTNEDDSAVTTWTTDFTVELHRNDGGIWKTVDSVTVTQAAPSFTFDLSGEKYEAPGVYAYQVVEIVPDPHANGMFYDPTMHTFSVYVSDADMDGQLEIVRIHSEHANKDFPQSGGVWLVQTDFHNVQYTTAPAVTRIDLQKILDNASGSTAVSLAGFEFGLFEDAACTIPLTDAVTGIQTIDVPATDSIGESRVEVIFDRTGSYTFYLKEISSGNTYMDYSSQVVKVTVDVNNGPGGRLVADVSYDTATNANGELEFTNTYDPADAELTIDFVSKVLNGRNMAAGEFTFELRSEGGGKLLEGSNAAATAGHAAAVTFDGTLKFDTVGTTYYQIVEVSGDGNGVIADKTTHWIMVTVADINGRLTASYALLTAVGDAIVFTNTYTATEISNVIAGNKTLNGRPLLNDEFTFVMTEVADADGTAKAGAQIWTTRNLANGVFHFPEITYTEAGTYYYELSEKAGSTAFGVRYDQTKFIATVKIVDNGNGALEVESVTYKVKGGSAVSDVVFVNNYVAAPTDVVIPGNKTLTGKVLGKGNFSFTLYKSDSSWTQGDEIETVRNEADGTFSFTKINYTKADTYYYLVKEVGGGTTVNGITYDDTVYRIRVTVTDDLVGQLHPRTVVFDGDDIPQAGVAFENTYAVTGSASATVKGDKDLDGRNMIDGEFTFELYETDSTLAISGTADQTAVNADRKFEFALTYAPEDVGKTFYYIIKEKVPAGAVNNKLNGVTYDAAVYVATVKVVDDGDGTMSAEAPVYYKLDGTVLTAVSGIRFGNTYEASSDQQIILSGTKTQSGKPLTTEKFTFELYAATKAADDTITLGTKLQTKQNNGAGIVFDSITYTTVDEIGTHYYVIKEQIPTGAVNNTLKGYTYDTATYVAVVTVEDNGDGTLKVTGPTYRAVGTDNKMGAVVSGFSFENTYDASADNGTVITAQKTQTGKPLTTEKFTFELYAATKAADDTITLGTKLQIKQNNGAAVSFDEIKYTSIADVGTHYYIVKEEIPAAAANNTLKGYTYDTAAYVAVVVVEDNGDGTLKVNVPTYYKLGADNKPAAAAATVVFENKYDASAENGALITAQKTQTGKDLTTEKFNFDLFSATVEAATGKIVVGTKLQTKQNVGAAIAFDEIKYTSIADVGTYYYVVKEQIPTEAVNNTLNGYTYDTAAYVAVITVDDNGDGTLKVTGPTYYALDADGKMAAAVSAVAFENSYDASADTGAVITAEKTLNGKTLTTELFTFELYNAKSETDGTVTVLDLLQTKQNDGTAIRFDEIKYTSIKEVGTHYYVVKEKIPTEAVENKLGTVTYDTAAYVAVVTVEDNGDGTLKVNAPAYYALGADNKPATATVEKVGFVNTHTPAAITVDITGEKLLKKDGVEVELDGKAFVFNLYEVNGTDKTLIATVKNADDGTFTFADLPADKAGVKTYLITEGESPYEGIDIDVTEYTVTVTVTDENGTLVADTAISTDGKAAEKLVFVNEYEPTPVPDPNPEPTPDPEPTPEPEPEPTPEPDTGVAGNLTLLFVLMFVSGAALTATAIFGKKRKAEIE